VKRPLKPEEVRVWGMVAATVHPMPGRVLPKREVDAPQEALPSPAMERATREASGVGRSSQAPSRPGLRPVHPSRKGEGKDPIEPRRHHRIAKERDPIGARLDLHGYGQDQARGVLERFLLSAWDEGFRAVLIITGKGVQGDGILRRRTPEWLAAPHLAHMVAGISEAHRRHGGEGALYVALKRKART
jgi:DNA-nicking Smr family endonuclease